MDEGDGETPLIQTDAEMRELLGMFEVPAFARRGYDLEYALKRLRLKLARDRQEMLEMVHLRLRQWAGAATGPDDFEPFASPISFYFQQAGAANPLWTKSKSSPRTRRTIARDLVASVERFNRRWQKLLGELKLETVNSLVDKYNRYYLLEKECSLGSSRLASRFFIPQNRLSVETLLLEYPLLSTPPLID